MNRDEELQAMQTYGAEDAEDLAMILEHLDKLSPAPATQELRPDTSSLGGVEESIRRRSNYRKPHVGEDGNRDCNARLS